MPTAKKFPKKKTIAHPPPSKSEVLLSDEVREESRKKMLATGDGSIGPTVNHMVKSRFRILYVRSQEERRVIDFFKNLAIYRGDELFHWDCDRGLLEAHSHEKVVADNSEVNEGDPTAILAHIIDHAGKQSKSMRENKKPKGAIYMLLDYHVFLEEMPPVQRKLKEFAETVSVCTLVIVAPTFNCPPTLEKEVTLIDFPVPSYDEINESLQKLAKEISVQLPEAAKDAKEHEEDLVKAASGLTLTEAENAYAMSVVAEKRFDIQRILEEKKQMIRKGGILEYREPRFKMDDLGGIDTLKGWLSLHRAAFKKDARQFGLPQPKGILIFGIPGSGKSAVCDALADLYQMPLLRLDFGAVFSAHVGDSEKNIRDCLRMAENIAPCVLGNINIDINGCSLKIEDLFIKEESDPQNETTQNQNDSQRVVYINKSMTVRGVDKEGVVKDVKVQAVIRTRKKERLIKIKTKSGKEIITTQNHMMMSGEKKMKKSKDFIKGETIYTIQQ